MDRRFFRSAGSIYYQGPPPAFVVRRIAPNPTDLISRLFPVIAISVAGLINVRGVLGNGMVSMSGDVYLEEGDEIAIFYESSGLTINLTLGGGEQSNTVWSVHKITDEISP